MKNYLDLKQRKKKFHYKTVIGVGTSKGVPTFSLIDLTVDIQSN